MTQDLIGKGWKQPTPTDLIERFKGDRFMASLYLVLLNRASNSDGGTYVDGVYIPLKRGQCIVGRFELAACFGMKRYESLRVYRKLAKLKRANKQITISKSRNCSVVTLLNYEADVAFNKGSEQSTNNQRAISEQSVNTNKNDKSEESVKNITPVPVKRALKCPNIKEGHKGCIEFIDGISEEFKSGQKFINYAKQIKFLHSMLRVGYSFEAINNALNSIDRDRFLGHNWDLATVAGYLDRKGGEQK